MRGPQGRQIVAGGVSPRDAALPPGKSPNGATESTGMSYTNLIYHIVFSTKDRRPLLKGESLARTCQFIGGIVRNLEGVPLAVGGMPDHVHVAARMTPKGAVSDVIGKVKSNSSRWIRQTLPELSDFGWQDEYIAFTVSRSAKDDVVAYVMNQEAHHRKMTFQEELIALLKKHDIEYDERYIRR